MEMRKCDVCGEEYSATYRSCPFCEENEVIRRGKPIHRHTSDFRNRRGGHALGVLALILALVVIGVGAVHFFGENIAQALGMREPINTEDLTDPDSEGDSVPISDAGSSGSDTSNPADGVMPSVGDDDALTPTEDDSTPSTQPTTPPSTAVALNSSDFTLDASRGLQYTLTASGGSGTYTWSSADTSVATVSEDGTVTGLRNGNTEVTVTDGFTTATCIVRIKGVTSTTTAPTGSTTLSLNRTDMTMPAGQQFQLKVSGTSSAVTWSIADTSIATIDTDGTVHFLKKGTTTATATVDGQSLQCIVRVS